MKDVGFDRDPCVAVFMVMTVGMIMIVVMIVRVVVMIVIIVMMMAVTIVVMVLLLRADYSESAVIPASACFAHVSKFL
jgi:hypothetical protein